MRAIAGRRRAALIWGALATLALVPVGLIALSPYIAYRGAIYIVAGIAGALALSILLTQPLLAAGSLPGLSQARARVWHRVLGSLLVVAVALHVGGLYLTSPQDALDALMLVAPTAFSVWGVLAMWALILTVGVVVLRRRLRLRPILWYWLHNALAAMVVLGSVIHALLIEGTMEPVSKWLLCLAVLVVSIAVLVHLRLLKAWRGDR